MNRRNLLGSLIALLFIPLLNYITIQKKDTSLPFKVGDKVKLSNRRIANDKNKRYCCWFDENLYIRNLHRSCDLPTGLEREIVKIEYFDDLSNNTKDYIGNYWDSQYPYWREQTIITVKLSDHVYEIGCTEEFERIV